jgi:hypothetical protein
MLNVTEKRYLLRNRNAAADLAGAVARLVDAQERLDELPASDPLRQLFEAQSVAEAVRLLHRHPGRIARAVGVEGVPALTVRSDRPCRSQPDLPARLPSPAPVESTATPRACSAPCPAQASTFPMPTTLDLSR